MIGLILQSVYPLAVDADRDNGLKGGFFVQIYDRKAIIE